MGGLSPESTAADIIAYLREAGTEESRQGMTRFGIKADKAFGVPNKVLRPIARLVQRDHTRALCLWDSGWREARILASFTADPKLVTREQAFAWAANFDSWEVVDHAADLLAASAMAEELIECFAADEREFARRAAFAMMAWSAVHERNAPDTTFLAWFPLIEQHAADGRNFVKKAVSWALRQIGKRSFALHQRAFALAQELAASPDSATRWVGKHATRELAAEKTIARLKARLSPSSSAFGKPG